MVHIQITSEEVMLEEDNQWADSPMLEEIIKSVNNKDSYKVLVHTQIFIKTKIVILKITTLIMVKILLCKWNPH